MEYEISKEVINDYLKLPRTFDWNWVDQELGFDKVFKIIPYEVYKALYALTDETSAEIYRLLTKASVHYAFILDIPRIKIQISNSGIDNTNQEKLKPASHFDIRDLGLKYLKTADNCLSKAITLLQTHALKNQIPFFSATNGIIATPAEFNNIYSINNSPEVFLQLLPLLSRAEDNFLKANISTCTLTEISTDQNLKSQLTTALAYYTLYYAASLPAFTLLSNAVVVQYEELPWQKSMILSETAREKAAEKFLEFANETLEIIITYLKNNTTQFPCYQTTASLPLGPVKKKSGLYL